MCQDKKQKSIIKMCGVEPESIVDGPGFRFVVFVQGCPHRCPGCHNPESHDFDGGYETTVEEVFEEFSSNPHLRGMTLSGGEPFCQAGALLELGKKVKAAGKDLMAFSGWTYEELLEKNDPAVNDLLDLLDILVDGRFEEDLKNLTLVYRGSENQRVIDMNKTRETGQVVLYQSEYGEL